MYERPKDIEGWERIPPISTLVSRWGKPSIEALVAIYLDPKKSHDYYHVIAHREPYESWVVEDYWIKVQSGYPILVRHVIEGQRYWTVRKTQ